MRNGRFLNAMSFEQSARAVEQDSRVRWAQQEVNTLDRAARLGTRALPEAQALAAACEVATRRLMES